MPPTVFLILLFLFTSHPAFGGEGSETGTKADPPDSEMILIPAGEFRMGSADRDIDWVVKEFFSESREWYLDETPAHTIDLPAFKIDKHEVTFGQYRRFVGETGAPASSENESSKFNRPDQPAVGVSWHDAKAYCRWAGKRLPTEAEWEKAARGTDSRRYPWGNQAIAKNANAHGKVDPYRYTAPVGQITEGESPYGLMDMSGNVWEWAEDWYQPYEGNTTANDFYGEQFRVIKGGAWNGNMDLARSAIRGKAFPDKGKNYIGFRCVQDVKKNGE